MKTSVLIKKLQELDPEDTAEVCIGNIDILYLDKMPHYYDGRLQRLKRKELDSFPYGVEYPSCNKIKIIGYSATDGLWDNPNFEIDYNDKNCQRHKEKDQEIREQSFQVSEDIECQHFEEFILKQAKNLNDPFLSIEGLKYTIKDFYLKNLGPNDPLPGGLKKEDGTCMSWNEARENQWLKEVIVFFDIVNDEWKIEFTDARKKDLLPHEQFLKNLEETLKNTKDKDLSLDILFEYVDDLLCLGEFEEVDKICLSYNPNRFDTTINVGILTITLAAKSKLKNRHQLFFNVKKCAERGYSERMLKGLE